MKFSSDLCRWGHVLAVCESPGRLTECHEEVKVGLQESETVMLPRHLRRAIPAPAPLRLAAFAASTHRSHALAALHYRRVAGATVSFHSSSRRRDELPKSPFQTFVDVLRDELRKNRELQENVKQLQGDVDKLQDSEAMRKARAAYERARVRFLVLPLLQAPLTEQMFLPAHLEHQREPAASGCC